MVHHGAHAAPAARIAHQKDGIGPTGVALSPPPGSLLFVCIGGRACDWRKSAERRDVRARVDVDVCRWALPAWPSLLLTAEARLGGCILYRLVIHDRPGQLLAAMARLNWAMIVRREEEKEEKGRLKSGLGTNPHRLPTISDRSWPYDPAPSRPYATALSTGCARPLSSQPQSNLPASA
ncbi:hypothetical protein GGTG_09449 [Gaeumannomyces tritici R3-111a-1]|uniref:Uncharacterized protein n=1 Tax=Gaeumannomyces tritici (strain R3-111a-1) TaxID=644352 RepID=J3P7F8_GAET3|nr:hypothetical protein GGTG_09449 [Gaeumannomyces tritici R3-111a-1]EJT72589.1 hypothetical protein GGTG_09449 [Gaeumannomyces tritici R3-111a-1]